MKSVSRRAEKSEGVGFRKSVGILGGGQLAQMMAEVADRVEAQVLVLDQDPDCPASTAGAKVISDPAEFWSSIDILTFENEFIDVGSIPKNNRFKIAPSLQSMARLQDKLSQKKLLNRLEILNPNYIEWDWNQQSAAKWIHDCRTQFSARFVIKWSRMGYDSKGVWIYREGDSLDEIVDFCERAKEQDIVVYSEQMIDYRNEVALVSCRSARGVIEFAPFTITEQQDGICHLAYGPADQFGIDVEVTSRAQNAAKKILNELIYVGALAIEFFIDQDSQLWVNEIAPRVHNSGHFTQDATAVSQFENHLRAILDLPLRPFELKTRYLMLNLVGPVNLPAPVLGPVLPEIPPELSEACHLHWYDKKWIKSKRKVGHINWVGSADEIEKIKSLNSNWLKKVLKAEEKTRGKK